MGIYNLQLHIRVTVLLATALPLLQAQEPKLADPDNKEGKVGEFTIKEQSSISLDSDKPPLVIDVNENQPLEPTLKTEKELYEKKPTQLEELNELAPRKERSGYVILPRLFEFRHDDVAHAYSPLQALSAVYKEKPSKAGLLKAYWEFKVADATGKIFMNYSGKGLPPQEVKIPTQNSEGEIIRVGNPHSGVLAYWDPAGKRHTAITESFSLPGLVHQKEGSFSIHLSLDHIFGKKDADEIVPDGKNLLEETVNWIKSHHAAQAPINVSVYAKTANVAEKQATIISKELSRALLRALNSIKAKGSASGISLNERIEVTVFSAIDQKRR